MKIATYTDDGYVIVDNDDVEFNVPLLVEMLHDKNVLSNDDVQRILPLGLDIID